MPIDRRSMLYAGLGAGLGTGLSSTPGAADAGPRTHRERLAAAEVPSAAEVRLKPGSAQDQSAALQAAIDAAASRGRPLVLPPGRFRTGKLQLRPGSRIVGTATTLEFAGGSAFLSGEGDGIELDGLVLDGAYQTLDVGQATGLVTLKKCRGLQLRGL